MYFIRESSKGYAIFYKDERDREEYISDNLSLKQARKWCDILNDAINKGFASNW